MLLFRMEDCPETEFSPALPFAQPGAGYRLTDQDTGESRRCSGEQLREGVSFSFDSPRSARLIWVEKE